MSKAVKEDSMIRHEYGSQRNDWLQGMSKAVKERLDDKAWVRQSKVWWYGAHSNALYGHKTWSTWVHVMTKSLPGPMWTYHPWSLVVFTRGQFQDTNHQNMLQICTFEIITISLRGQWVNNVITGRLDTFRWSDLLSSYLLFCLYSGMWADEDEGGN